MRACLCRDFKIRMNRFRWSHCYSVARRKAVINMSMNSRSSSIIKKNTREKTFASEWMQRKCFRLWLNCLVPRRSCSNQLVLFRLTFLETADQDMHSFRMTVCSIIRHESNSLAAVENELLLALERLFKFFAASNFFSLFGATDKSKRRMNDISGHASQRLNK